jgi:integrase
LAVYAVILFIGRENVVSMPHKVQKVAGHADIKTTMNYYVGIRDSLTDRARIASSAVLAGNSRTVLP